MGDIYISHNEDGELTHSAAGSTWQKKGAAYISRVRKNGKWVYTYASKKAGQAGRAVATGASNVANTVSTAVGNANRAARSAVASSRVNPDVISTRLRKKTRKNIAKGKARVNAILERLRESASSTAKLANRKYKAAQKVAGSTVTKVKETARNTASKAKKTATNTAIKANKTATSTVSRAKKTTKRATNKVKKKIQKGLNPSSGTKGNYNSGTIKLSNGTRVHFSDVELSKPHKPKKRKS